MLCFDNNTLTLLTLKVKHTLLSIIAIARILFFGLIVVWLLPTTAYSQAKQDLDAYLEVADELFEEENYSEAKLYYEKAAKFYEYNGYSAFKLGECHNKLYDYKKASEWYGKAYDREGAKYPQALLMKASLLKMEGKYEESKKVLDRFQMDFTPDPARDEDTLLVRRAIVESEGIDMALDKKQPSTADYDFKKLSTVINTPKYPEFAAVLYEGDSSIVVTSHSPESQGRTLDRRLGMPFSDNVRYKQSKQGVWSKNNKNDNFDVINTVINDGAGVFNKDRTKYYYTSCYEGNGECKIYVSVLLKGKWQKPISLNTNINKVGYDNKHPALSATGDTLFFVSTRPGGKGMNDIWYSVSSGGNDTWTAPINLEQVNTTFEEMSPFFFSNTRTLFFSSKGFKGLGGLDIYMLRLDGQGSLVNVGAPFNSPRDDFYFVLGENTGYLSSNRGAGDGANYDLYSFKTDNKLVLLASLEQDGIKDVVVTGASARKKKMSDEEAALKGSLAFQQLSPEQQTQIMRFIAASVASKNYAGDSSLLSKDQFYYQKLPSDERARLDRYALYKNVQNYYGVDPELMAKDAKYYEKLPIEEQNRHERLLMSQMAALLTEKDQALKASDRQFFEKQSVDNKNAIERIAKFRNYKNSYIHEPSLQKQDEAFYNNLPADIKNTVDRISQARDGGKVYALTPTLKEKDDYFYNNLTAAEKQKIDRIIAWKQMQEVYAKDPALQTKDRLYYDKLSAQERASVDRIIAARISSSQYLKDAQLRQTEKNYYAALSADDKNRIERMAAERLMRLVYEVGTINLLNADLAYLQQLPTEQRTAIERFVSYKTDKYFYGDDAELRKQDEFFYQSLPEDIRALIDRMILERLAGKYKNDDAKIKNKDRISYKKMLPEERTQVSRIIDARANRNPYGDVKLKERDDMYYQQLSAEEKEELDRMVSNRMANSSAADDLKLKKSNDFDYRSLSAEEKARIDRIIEARLGHNVYGNDDLLRKEDDMYYKNLPYNSKTAINKIIAHRKAGKGTIIDDLTLSEKDKFFYQQLELEKRKQIDRIVESLLGNNIYGKDLDLKAEDELVYKNLSAEEKASVDAIVAERKRAMSKQSEDLTAGLLEKDKAQYYKLSAEEKERLNRMIQDRMGKDVYGDDLALKKADEQYYASLSPEEKSSIDNIVNNKTANKLILSDAELKQGHYRGEPAMVGRVFFDANQVNIRFDGYKFLDFLVDYLKTNSGKKLYILAHSDSFGNDAYNLDLSRKRAKNTKEYLTKRGVKIDIVMPEGKGEAFPLMPNTTAYGRKMNRRAEFYITDK